jgi:4-hydroxy-2-oxoheptanedioate aldolase
MATADDDMICMITIEHVEAVERIDEIMATPGIDVAVIGPGDLATSINKRGRADDPEVLDLIARAGPASSTAASRSAAWRAPRSKPIR